MKLRLVTITGGFLFVVCVGVVLRAQQRAGDAPSAATEDQLAEKEIRRLYDVEHSNLVRMDIAAQGRFLPDDFVCTNPFNMFIDKPTVMERIRADIIKYTSYEREYDYFRLYGNTVVVVGSETVVPAPDAKLPYKGKINRRFTEMWVRRDGTWQKVVRHASNAPGPAAPAGSGQSPAPPAAGAQAAPPAEEKPVRETVQRFYDTFNSHDWGRIAESTTEDWTHINPLGGWTRGRDAVVKSLKEAHATFLKGVTDTPDEIEVRFATADVAVVTVPSTMKGTFTTPDGTKHENDRNIRTFVVVQRGGKWLIMQDQNTKRGG
jgi:uncharacterized protein (TIGR02246 family)